MDAYILAGQSNMVGVGALSEALKPVNPSQIFMFNPAGAWDPAKDPIKSSAHWQIPVGVGPGISFADAMATAMPGYQIGLVQCAVGGSSLAPALNNAPWVWYWQPTLSALSLYGNMFIQVLRATRLGGVIKGLLWYQGENETADRNNVILYDSRMYSLFASMRHDFGENLPIVFVKLGPNPNRPDFPMWFDIQQWQQAIANTHLPYTAMVDASDLHSLPGPQNVHLDGPSQIILGQRLAAAMLELLSQCP